MPAFKKFGDGDQIDNVLILQPRYELSSGSSGWHGSPDANELIDGNSISLYGGLRRGPERPVTSIEYQSNYPNAFQTGNPRRGNPLTASVRMVWMTDEELNLSERTDTRWGREHWGTVQRLYQDYYAIDPDYVTGTYDHYCVFFQRDSRNIVGLIGPAAEQGLVQFDQISFPSGSWTVESWIKPLTTSSLSNDFTIASMNRSLWFGITGSTGRLMFSSSVGNFTSSFGPPKDRWSHVVLKYDSTSQTGSFRIDLLDAGTFVRTPMAAPSNYTASFTVGGMWSGTVAINSEFIYQNGPYWGTEWNGLPARSFHGMMGETRFWKTHRTDVQLSSSWNRPLIATEATGAFYSLRFNEGPLFDFGLGDTLSTPSVGSGTFNQGANTSYGVFTTTPAQYAYLASFDDRVGPVWLPNDNTRFITPKRFHDPGIAQYINQYLDENGSLLPDTSLPFRRAGIDRVHRMLVIAVPSAFYGRQIVPDSVKLVCEAYSSGSWGLQRTLIDDGRGGLFVSGSMSAGTDEDYRGVEWNKVGNVFYGEGLIVIKEPSLLDFGRTDGAYSDADLTFQLSFRGDTRIPVKTLMCRIDHGEFNATQNETFYDVDEDGTWDRRFVSGNVRVTTVGVYNSDRELVGVARLADPVRLRPRDRINIKLRMDF